MVDFMAGWRQGNENLNRTLSDLAAASQQREQLAMQRGQQERINRLSDLQIRSGERELQRKQAEDAALVSQYGAPDLPQALEFQAQEKQMAEERNNDMSAIKEIFDLIGKVREKGVSGTAITPVIQGLAAAIKNSKLREVYSNLQLNDTWGAKTKVALDGSEGYVHPVTKKPLSAGVYEIEFDDKQQPVKVDFVQEIKPNQSEILDKRFQQQLELQDRRDKSALERQERQIAASDARQARQLSSIASRQDSKGRPSRPMPPTALKMQQAEIDAIQGAASMNANIDKFYNQINSGELNLGLFRNIINRGRNIAGQSTPESRNLESFRATLEKIRNDSLRLNKGVQTEGDAQRAWNELVSNINDEEVVKQRLREIRELNDMAVLLRQENVSRIRENYGQNELEMTPRERPASSGPPAGPAASGGRNSNNDAVKKLRNKYGIGR